MPVIIPAAISLFELGQGILVGAGLSEALATTILVSGIEVGVNEGINGIAGLFKKNSADTSVNAINSQTNIRQAISNWRVIYGSVVTPGVITFIGVSGTNNEYLHLVFTLAAHEVNAVNAVYFDGKVAPGHTITLNGGTPTGGAAPVFPLMEIDTGDPSNTSQPFPGLATDLPSKWTSAHLQRGHAKVHLKLKWDSTFYTSGLPNISFAVEGKKCFDPRTSTTAHTDNPALCLRDYLTDTVYGMKVADADIDDDTVTAAANICEETVALKAGGDDQRYKCWGLFDTTSDRGDIIKGIASSMAGIAVPPSDKWRIYAGAYREPSLSITDDDLRGPIQASFKLSRRDLCNGVKGTYVGGTTDWEPSDYPAYLSSAYVTEDGGEQIYQDLNLPFTAFPNMAQRLAKIQLERTRRQVSMTLQCKLKAYQLQVGDTFEFTHNRFGYDSKVFEVQQVSLAIAQAEDGSPTLGVDLQVKETDSDVYAWDPDTDEGTVGETGSSILPDPTNIVAPTSLSLESDSGTDLVRSDGVVLTRILATWTSPLEETVINGGQIEVWMKKDSDSTYNRVGLVNGDETSYFINNVNDGDTYNVHLIAVSVSGSKSDATGDETVVASSTASDFSGNLNGTPSQQVVDGSTGESGDIAFINGNFEMGTASPPQGYQYYSNTPTISYDTSTQFEGTRSLKITSPSATGGSGVRATRQVACREGDVLYASVQAKVVSGSGRAIISISFREADGTSIEGFSLSTSSSSWTHLVTMGTAPSGTVYATFEIYTDAASTVVEFDQHYARYVPAVTIAAHSSYRPLSNPLTATDAGSSATVSIASFSMQVAGLPSYSLSSGSITGLSFKTLYYIYYSDPAYNGGSVTYQSSTTKEDALVGSGNFFVGAIFTPEDGGADTIGNNDGGSGAQDGSAIIIPFADVSYTNGSRWGSITGTGSISNIANAIDGSNATASTQTVTHGAGTAWIQLFGPSGVSSNYSSMKVKILWEMTANDLSGGGAANALTGGVGKWIPDGSGGFSLDRTGVTGTFPIQAMGAGTVGKTVTEFTLAPRYNIGQLVAQFNLTSNADKTAGSATVKVYGAWIEAYK